MKPFDAEKNAQGRPDRPLRYPDGVGVTRSRLTRNQKDIGRLPTTGDKYAGTYSFLENQNTGLDHKGWKAFEGRYQGQVGVEMGYYVGRNYNTRFIRR